MHNFGTLTRFVFVLISAALFSACTTAPGSIADFIPAPKKVEVLPPAPKSEPLTTTKTQAEISHDDGVVVAIPATLPKPAAKKASKKKKATAAAATATATADTASEGIVVKIPESVSATGDVHRSLEGSDECCGTGCSKACVVE